MPDSRENTVSVRIYESTQDELLDEQRRVKKATGDKPSIADLIARNWEAYKSPVTPNRDTETRSGTTNVVGNNISNTANTVREIAGTSDISVLPGEATRLYDVLSDLTQAVRAMHAQLARMELRLIQQEGGRSDSGESA